MPEKAIILSAGLGTRLGDLTRKTPKCLMSIQDSTILDKQIETLEDIGLSRQDILIVIGKHGECWNPESTAAIRKRLDRIVVNDKNTETKNTYSLLIGMDDIDEDTDLLVIDGDTVFSEDLLLRMRDIKNSCVASKRSEDPEEKRNKMVFDSSDRILDMGKDLAKEKLPFPYSVFGAILRIRKEDIRVFLDVLYAHREDSLDKVVKDLAKRTELHKVDHEGWVNINTLEDLAYARKMFS